VEIGFLSGMLVMESLVEDSLINGARRERRRRAYKASASFKWIIVERTFKEHQKQKDSIK
jgi:hypothetical protein